MVFKENITFWRQKLIIHIVVIKSRYYCRRKACWLGLLVIRHYFLSDYIGDSNMSLGLPLPFSSEIDQINDRIIIICVLTIIGYLGDVQYGTYFRKQMYRVSMFRSVAEEERGDVRHAIRILHLLDCVITNSSSRCPYT